MKKLAAYFFFLVLFISCKSGNWDDTIIRNDSGFDVLFEFSNSGKIDLPAGEQTTFLTEAYQRLVSYSPEKRVYFTYEATNEGYSGWFLDRESWNVKVNNAIGENAALGADDWMDEIEIPSDGNDFDAGKVYTDYPVFIITKTDSNFPAAAVYNRDTDGTFRVTIQR
jgi:hypothetical protein